jgi:hypothetical protein
VAKYMVGQALLAANYVARGREGQVGVSAAHLVACK